ncbi:TRAP transporter small permease [Neoroseomonas rubea]|uniref:TRAP transporter small permease n=1 Tax=Neoroseomonas rubea TaxID=2748666 RepID=UPI0018E00EF2
MSARPHLAPGAEEPPALRAFTRALDMLSALTVGLAGIALVVLIAMMGWLVFGRYVLNDTPTWIERAATLAILAIAMPVAAVGVRERFHLSVLGVREALPRAAQRWIAMGCDALMGLFGLGMAIWSWELVGTVANFRIPLLGISQGWTYAPMVVGGALMTLYAIEQVLHDIYRRDAPEKRGVAAAFLE